MFGYVKTYTPELKVIEHEYYKAAYCGLCRSMGKCTGQCSRMTLSYDFAFLALIRLALNGEDVSFARRRCIAHPLHKRKMMERNAQLDYCAYAAALLTYHKLSDDISDEKGARRALAVLSRPIARKMRRRAIRKDKLNELDLYIAEKLTELSRFEASGELSVDMPADIFGELLSRIVSFGLDGREARIAADIGRHVGRWIYITDAMDDFSEDAERGRYNPFFGVYGKEIDKETRERIANALKNELCDAERALDLIEFGENTVLKNIVNNIFYLGMPRTADAVISGESDSKDSRKKKLCKKGQSEDQ